MGRNVHRRLNRAGMLLMGSHVWLRSTIGKLNSIVATRHVGRVGVVAEVNQLAYIFRTKVSNRRERCDDDVAYGDASPCFVVRRSQAILAGYPWASQTELQMHAAGKQHKVSGAHERNTARASWSPSLTNVRRPTASTRRTHGSRQRRVAANKRACMATAADKPKG